MPSSSTLPIFLMLYSIDDVSECRIEKEWLYYKEEYAQQARKIKTLEETDEKMYEIKKQVINRNIE